MTDYIPKGQWLHPHALAQSRSSNYHVLIKHFRCLCSSTTSNTSKKYRFTDWNWFTFKSCAMCWRQCNPNNLCILPMSSSSSLSIPIGLWNCQSAIIYRYSFRSPSRGWIKPEDTATPTALSSNFTFSHTPRLGGVEVLACLMSNEWKFNPLPSHCGNSSFESHAITIPPC